MSSKENTKAGFLLIHKVYETHDRVSILSTESDDTGRCPKLK